MNRVRVRGENCARVSLSLSLSGAGKIMARDAKLIRSRATCSADYKAPNRRAVTMQGCGTIAKAAGAANLQTAK